MALTKFTDDVEIIQALSNTPNATEGLTADQLKAKFDEATGKIKTFLNDTLTEEVDTRIDAVEDGIEALENGIAGVLDWIYPVGTIYETTSTDLDTTTKMANHFGGTWEVYGAGRVLVAKSADTEFDTVEETGGAKTHTLTIDEMANHTHRVSTRFSAAAGAYNVSGVNNTGVETIDAVATSNTGGGKAHNNLQPYIVVYRYRRTA